MNDKHSYVPIRRVKRSCFSKKYSYKPAKKNSDTKLKVISIISVPIFLLGATSVCAASVRRFNKEAASHPDTVVLAVSKDLPFAHGRFCTTEGIDKVITLSVFRCSCFEDKYGMLLVDGPLKGLLARGVIVVDGAGKVVYEELVPEITTEPNYDAALAALK